MALKFSSSESIFGVPNSLNITRKRVTRQPTTGDQGGRVERNVCSCAHLHIQVDVPKELHLNTFGRS